MRHRARAGSGTAGCVACRTADGPPARRLEGTLQPAPVGGGGIRLHVVIVAGLGQLTPVGVRPGQIRLGDESVVLAEPHEDRAQHPRHHDLGNPLVQPRGPRRRRTPELARLVVTRPVAAPRPHREPSPAARGQSRPPLPAASGRPTTPYGRSLRASLDTTRYDLAGPPVGVAHPGVRKLDPLPPGRPGTARPPARVSARARGRLAGPGATGLAPSAGPPTPAGPRGPPAQRVLYRRRPCRPGPGGGTEIGVTTSGRTTRR